MPTASSPRSSSSQQQRRASNADPDTANATGHQFLTPSPSILDAGEAPARASKRRRINFACDYCRSRKTRCDEGQPSCYACLAAGIKCVTRSRRQPWVDVRRHEAGRPPGRTRGGAEEITPRQRNEASAVDATGAAASLTVSENPGDSPSAASPRRRRRLPYHVAAPSAVEASDTQSAKDHQRHLAKEHPSASGEDRPRKPHDRHAQSDEERTDIEARLPIVQIDPGNTPLELMTSWLDLARYRLRIPRPGLRQPTQSSRGPSNTAEGSPDESVLPRSLGIWNIPDLDVVLTLVDSFLEGPNILFPLLQPDAIKHAARTASRSGPGALTQECGLPVLMQVYLVMILGHASQPSRGLAFDSEGCLKYSESLLGLILQQSTLQSLQAAMLLSMALRCHDKLAAAGHAMSLAVSMAVALGLPRYSPRLLPGEERRTTWMSVFAFEKLLSFELGRSSLIPDDYPELLPDSRTVSDSTGGALQNDSGSHSVFSVVLSLAKVLGEVGRWCVQISRKEDDKSDEHITEVVKEKVRTTGRSCLRLMEWASDICPSPYRPTSDLLLDSSLYPFTSFVAMQYHAALILVTRNSLLISEKAIRLAVDVVAKNEPWESAVRNGQSLAVNSARRILRLFLESCEHEHEHEQGAHRPAALPSLAGPLHAMGVLAVFVATRPDSRMAGMDRELLRAAAMAVGNAQVSGLVERELGFAINRLDTLVAAAASLGARDEGGPRSSQRSRVQSPAPPLEPSAREQPGGLAGEQQPHWQPATLEAGAEIDAVGNMQDDNLAYAGWWPEDNSPMIMDEFGWNWANFSQLLEGHSDEHQMQI